MKKFKIDIPVNILAAFIALLALVAVSSFDPFWQIIAVLAIAILVKSLLEDEWLKDAAYNVVKIVLVYLLLKFAMDIVPGFFETLKSIFGYFDTKIVSKFFSTLKTIIDYGCKILLFSTAWEFYCHDNAPLTIPDTGSDIKPALSKAKSIVKKTIQTEKNSETNEKEESTESKKEEQIAESNKAEQNKDSI